MKHTVCVVTATRAEYGLLRPLLVRMDDAEWCELQLVVTGAHFSVGLGETWRGIEKDGFPVANRVMVPLSGESELEVARSAGVLLTEFAGVFADLNPEAVVLLGDRYEMVAVALAAFLQRIPIVHLYGGDVTTGALDDGLRHSITKLSRLHFTATEDSRLRVIQLGEHPDCVFRVGALGVDVACSEATLSESDTREFLNLKGPRPYVLASYHPETVLSDCGIQGLRSMLGALDELDGIDVVLTGSNADARGREFNCIMREWAAAHPDRARYFPSLGSPHFLCAMRWASAVVGNSSSAIVEAPSLGTPSLNIGNRQQGRERAGNVIDVSSDLADIRAGLARALGSPHSDGLAENPWGDGHAAEKILSILETQIELIGSEPKPPFYDVGCVEGGLS